MNIVFIGAGNVATHLAKALYRAGHEIVQVYSRTSYAADRLADLFECAATTNIDDVCNYADAYIFAVKDSVLGELSAALARRLPDKLFIHTAGSMGVEVLGVGRGAVLYPMQTFSRDREVNFADVSVFVEALRQDDLEVVRSLAKDLTEKVYELSGEERRSLHIAAVFCCNFANHCYALSEKVLGRHGIPFDVMLPLVDETARKVHEMSPVKAQTGPAVRWDENVMARHMEMLKDDERMLDIYRTMSESIHAMNDN